MNTNWVVIFTLWCIHQTRGVDQHLLRELVSSKERSVSRICDGIRSYYSSTEIVTECDKFPSCDSDLKNTIISKGGTMNCQPNFGNDEKCTCGSSHAELSFDTSVARYAPNVKTYDFDVKKFMCSTTTLNGVFQQNKMNDPSISWQYVGSPSGAYVLWPGISDKYRDAVHSDNDTCKRYQSSSCPSYDCRLRPWYIASATGSKDLVLVLDISASMSGERMRLMIDATKSVISGLGYYDRLAVVTFSDQGKLVCSQNGFNRTSTSAKERFNQCLDALRATGATNCTGGLNAAFSVFENDVHASSTACHKIVLFMTDGECNNAVDVNHVKLEAERHGVIFFTFALGSGGDVTTATDIACATHGVASQVTDFYQLKQAVSFYYDYYWQGSSFRDSVIWSELYYDFSGLGWMTTVSLGCYQTETRELLGVAGVDVLVGEFDALNASFEHDVAPLLYNVSEQYCNYEEMNECQIESFRPLKCNSDLSCENGGFYNSDCVCSCRDSCENGGTIRLDCSCKCLNTCGGKMGDINDDCSCSCYRGCERSGQLQDDCTCTCPYECENGGELDVDCTCICQEGYSGISCDIDSLSSPSTAGKTAAIVVASIVSPLILVIIIVTVSVVCVSLAIGLRKKISRMNDDVSFGGSEHSLENGQRDEPVQVVVNAKSENVGGLEKSSTQSPEVESKDEGKRDQDNSQSESQQ